MSMHRPKRANVRRADGPDTSGGASKGPAKLPKWEEAVAQQPDASFIAYDTTKTYAQGAFVSHAKFGKGLVIEVDGNKVSILFEEGTKRLLAGG